MHIPETPENFRKSLRLLSAHTVLVLEGNDAVDLGVGFPERRDTFDLMACLWRKVTLGTWSGRTDLSALARPEMAWVGMSRFLGALTDASADLMDHSTTASTYTSLLEEFGY